MPLDEKEKKALKERYKEHRQAIWSGKHSRKLNREKDKSDADNFVSDEKEKSPRPTLIEDKGGGSAEQPKKSGHPKDAISIEESPKLADYDEQNQMVILRRTKEKKSVNEGPTKKMPPFSERTTLYEPESTHKTEVKLSSPDVKTTMFASLTDDFVLRRERSESQSNSSSALPNAAELSTKVEVIADTMTSPENILKEKIRNQRQEIWTGASSQKKSRPKLKKDKKAEESLGVRTMQISQEPKKGLTLGVVFIGIAAVVIAVVLGVLLGYLLA